MTADTNHSSKVADMPFTEEEALALMELRRRYKAERDLFSPRELAHLRFLRWRVDSGRLRS